MSETTTTTAAAAAATEKKLELNDWGYFLMSISWIFCVISFIICCYAIYAGYIHYKKQKASSKNAKRLQQQLKVMILTISCMFLFTAINICDSIGLPHWFANEDGQYDWWWNADETYIYYDWEQFYFNWEHSDKSYLMWNVFWAISKILLYIVYLQRIYVIFGGTKYAPSQAVYCLIVIILLIQSGLVCSWCWYYNISYSCCDIWADDQYETLAWLAWWILIVDIILTLGLTLLFLYCMKKLFQSISTHHLNAVQMDEVTIGSKSELSAGSVQTGTAQTEQKEDNNQDESPQNTSQRHQNLIKTATRVFVLAMISLCSSIFYQFLFGIAITEEFYGSHVHTAFYYFSFTWNVDSTLNVICLFLSLSFSKKWYYKICKCDNCCYQCIENRTT